LSSPEKRKKANFADKLLIGWEKKAITREIRERFLLEQNSATFKKTETSSRKTRETKR